MPLLWLTEKYFHSTHSLEVLGEVFEDILLIVFISIDSYDKCVPEIDILFEELQLGFGHQLIGQGHVLEIVEGTFLDLQFA